MKKKNRRGGDSWRWALHCRPTATPSPHTHKHAHKHNQARKLTLLKKQTNKQTNKQKPTKQTHRHWQRQPDQVQSSSRAGAYQTVPYQKKVRPSISKKVYEENYNTILNRSESYSLKPWQDFLTLQYQPFIVNTSLLTLYFQQFIVDT